MQKALIRKLLAFTCFVAVDLLNSACKPTPNGWILMSENIMIPTLGELGGHLEAAEKKFAQNELTMAAKELRLAINALSVEITRAIEVRRENLRRAAENLSAVAGQLVASIDVARPDLPEVLPDFPPRGQAQREAMVSLGEPVPL